MSPDNFIDFLNYCRNLAEESQRSMTMWGEATEVLVVERPLHYYVVFAGTNPLDLRDVRDDCCVRFKDFIGLRVHEGIDHRTAPTFKHSLGLSKPLILVGHSLGGAIATHLALQIPERVKAVVTFGAPAVGCKLYARRVEAILGSKLIRVVNGQDRVPRFWLQRLMGYKQSKPYFYIDYERKVHYNPGKFEKYKDWILGGSFKDSVEDHYIANYKISGYDPASFRLPELMEVEDHELL